MAYALAAHVVSSAGRMTMTTITLTGECPARVATMMELLTDVAATETDTSTLADLVHDLRSLDHAIEFPLASLAQRVRLNGGTAFGPAAAVELQHDEISALQDLLEVCSRVTAPRVLLAQV